MKICTVICFTIFFVNLLFAQNKPSEWEEYNTVNNVTISYKYIDCNNPGQGTFKEYVVFRFQNNNTVPVKIEWDQIRYYDNKDNTSENSIENHKELILGSEEIFESSCDTGRGFNIFSKFLNYKTTELIKFELSNIKVTFQK